MVSRIQCMKMVTCNVNTPLPTYVQSINTKFNACVVRALNYPGTILIRLKTNLDRNMQWLDHSNVQPNKEHVTNPL